MVRTYAYQVLLRTYYCRVCTYVPLGIWAWRLAAIESCTHPAGAAGAWSHVSCVIHTIMAQDIKHQQDLCNVLKQGATPKKMLKCQNIEAIIKYFSDNKYCCVCCNEKVYWFIRSVKTIGDNISFEGNPPRVVVIRSKCFYWLSSKVPIERDLHEVFNAWCMYSYPPSSSYRNF